MLTRKRLKSIVEFAHNANFHMSSITVSDFRQLGEYAHGNLTIFGTQFLGHLYGAKVYLRKNTNGMVISLKPDLTT